MKWSVETGSASDALSRITAWHLGSIPPSAKSRTVALDRVPLQPACRRRAQGRRGAVDIHGRAWVRVALDEDQLVECRVDDDARLHDRGGELGERLRAFVVTREATPIVRRPSPSRSSHADEFVLERRHDDQRDHGEHARDDEHEGERKPRRTPLIAGRLAINAPGTGSRRRARS